MPADLTLGQGGEGCSSALGATPGSATRCPPVGLYSSAFSRETEARRCYVSSGRHRKIPQSGRLEQQKFVSPGSGVWLSKISMPVESKAGDSPVLKA